MEKNIVFKLNVIRNSLEKYKVRLLKLNRIIISLENEKEAVYNSNEWMILIRDSKSFYEQYRPLEKTYFETLATFTEISNDLTAGVDFETHYLQSVLKQMNESVCVFKQIEDELSTRILCVEEGRTLLRLRGR